MNGLRTVGVEGVGATGGTEVQRSRRGIAVGRGAVGCDGHAAHRIERFRVRLRGCTMRVCGRDCVLGTGLHLRFH